MWVKGYVKISSREIFLKLTKNEYGSLYKKVNLVYSKSYKSNDDTLFFFYLPLNLNNMKLC